jgi:hypothetical protein
MKVNEFANSSFKILCAHPALPAASKMFSEPFYAASAQLTIRRENKILISRMSISKPHTSPLSRTCQTRQGPLQRKGNCPERNIENLCNFAVPEPFCP